MDIQTISIYRNLEQQAIKQSKKRAFSHDFIRMNNPAPMPVPAPKEQTQPTTKMKGFNHYA